MTAALPIDHEVVKDRHDIIRSRMKGYLRRNVAEMKRWNQIVAVENQTMTISAINALASSNIRAAAAHEIARELEFADTVEHFEETLAFKLRAEMSASGRHEKLAVFLEAHQILTGEDKALGF